MKQMKKSFWYHDKQWQQIPNALLQLVLAKERRYRKRKERKKETICRKKRKKEKKERWYAQKT